MRSKKLIVTAVVFGIAFLLHVIVLLNLPISKLGILFSLPVSSLLLCALPSALIASLVLLIDKSLLQPCSTDSFQEHDYNQLQLQLIAEHSNITWDEDNHDHFQDDDNICFSPTYSNFPINVYHDND